MRMAKRRICGRGDAILGRLSVAVTGILCTSTFHSATAAVPPGCAQQFSTLECIAAECINSRLDAGTPALSYSPSAPSARNLRGDAEDLRVCHPSLRVCGPPLSLGEGCTSHSQCNSRLCNAFVCTAPRSIAPGLLCDADLSCAKGYCRAGRCVAYALESHPCSPDITVPLGMGAGLVFQGRPVQLPTGEPRCDPGFFSDTRSFGIRESNDPEYDLLKKPLICRVYQDGEALQGTGSGNASDSVSVITTKGVCEPIRLGGKGDSCIMAQTPADLLPGVPRLPFSAAANVGFCDRGLYPKSDVTGMTCTCVTFVEKDDPCVFHQREGSFVLIDKCEYGTVCAMEASPSAAAQFTVMAGKCKPWLGGEANDFAFAPPGEGAGLQRHLLCDDKHVFSELTNSCVSHVDQPCQQDSDCILSNPGQHNTVVCQKSAGCLDGALGKCVPLHSVCHAELKALVAFDADRARTGALVSGPWGSFTGSLSGFESKYNLAKAYTCCLHSEIEKHSSLYYHFNLHVIDTSATGMCDESFPLLVVVVSAITGTMGILSFIVIFAKDIVPSHRMHSGSTPSPAKDQVGGA